MFYRVAIGRICWPWQLVYLLLLEKVLHYTRTMWRSVIVLKQNISSEALSSIWDKLGLQQLSISVAVDRILYRNQVSFSAMMNSHPNMNRTSTCHDSTNNTVLSEPFTLLSPHTDSSVRAMKQKPGLIGVDYMAPMS
jgi:hypothetical protein